jgi:hypothetical protein
MASRMRSTSDALPPDAYFHYLRARADGPLGRPAWRADERRIEPDGSRWWTRGGAAGLPDFDSKTLFSPGYSTCRSFRQWVMVGTSQDLVRAGAVAAA